MKFIFYYSIGFFSFFIATNTTAQSAADYAIQLEAVVQTAPPSITLSWRPVFGATNYTIERKSKTAIGWLPLTATPDTFYVDVAVASDSAYEYRVRNTASSASGGYIYAGINAKAIHNKGGIVVLIDTLFRDSCAASVQQLLEDLSGDGWAVYRHDLPRTLPDSMVKKVIKNEYANRSNVKAILIVGHIAVPYSGDLNPDAHPDHQGAWPADNYYADMDGIWTDVSVNDTVASRSQNDNRPGDGKWDQSGNPSAIELQISRIDFANMPAFGKSEPTMMNSYLAKAHLFKTDALYISKKAVVDDNFGAFSGEAFAANAWRNFPSLVGRGNVFAGDFITMLNDSAYIWGYGCGGGSYTSCGGVGTTTNLVTKNQKGIFTMLFGSYFGDWDNQNNFLRAPLCCAEPALTSGWAGRPNWFLHHMSLGENIGLGKLLTDNNLGLYTPYGYTTTGVHVALMGDLSLRTQYIKPASNVRINALASGATIEWTASPDASVLGYYVYRADSLYGNYVRISGLVADTTFSDTVGVTGFYHYMVRPTRLESTPSGTYYNLGLGTRNAALVTFIPTNIFAKNIGKVELMCFPNPTNNIVNIYVHFAQQNGMATVAIMDMSGKLLFSEKHNFNEGEFTLSASVKQWATGMYLVQISDDHGTIATHKFIKQ